MGLTLTVFLPFTGALHMTRLKHFPLTALLSAVLALASVIPATAQTAAAAPNTTGPSGSGVNNALLYATAWKQTAAEYRALTVSATIWWKIVGKTMSVLLKSSTSATQKKEKERLWWRFC